MLGIYTDVQALFWTWHCSFQTVCSVFFPIYKPTIRRDKQSIHKKLYTVLTVELTTLRISSPFSKEHQATSALPQQKQRTAVKHKATYILMIYWYNAAC